MESSGFNIERRPGILILYCRRDLNSVTSDEAVELLRTALADPSDSSCEFVLDLANQVEISPVFLRAVAPLVRSMKEKGRKLHVVQAPKTVARYLRDAGMDGLIHVIDSLVALSPASGPEPSPAPPKAAAPRARIDTAFINPFLDATINTFKVQCELEFTPGKPFLKGPESPFGIGAEITLASPAFHGTIALYFSESAYLAIMSKIFMAPQTALTDEIRDGAGELLNIIFGQAKRMLNERGYEISMAIPRVFKSGEAASAYAGQALALPFESVAGPIQVEIRTQAS